MKKRNVFFKNGVRLASFLIVGSSLAVIPSCYDDNDIKSSIDNLDDRVTELEKAVTSMQSEIASIKQITSVLEENALVSSVIEDEEGNVLVVFSNDTQTLIQNLKSMSDSEALSKAPVLALIEEDGKHYWGVNSNNGVVALLDADGNKMPVSGKSPMVRINSKTKEWEVSTNEGALWGGTGVYAEDDNALISSIDQDDNYVYFNLAGDVQIKIAKETEMSLTIVSGPQFLNYGQSVVLPLRMKGVYKSAISKPDGWRVSITEDGLLVKSPSENNEYAELEGVVALTAVSSNGKSIIEEVNVKVGEVPVKFDVKKDNITASANESQYYFLGITKASDFSVDYVKKYLSQDFSFELMKSSNVQLDAAEIDSRVEIVPGVDYIIWAVPSDWGNDDYTRMVTTAYMKEPHRSIKFTFENITRNDADIILELENCEKYFIGTAGSLDYFDKEYLFETVNYNSDVYKAQGNKIKLSSLYSTYGSPVNCVPSNTYKVWAYPVKQEYTIDDIFELNVTLADPDYNGTATVTISEIKKSTTSLSCKLTPSADASTYYYGSLPEFDFNLYNSDKDILSYLLMNGRKSTLEENLEMSYLNPESKYYVCSFAIDSEGKYGQLVKQEIVTESLSFDGTASATAEVTPKQMSSDIVLSPSGNVKQYRYLNLTVNEFLTNYQENDENVLNALALNSFWGMQTVDASSLENNTINVSNLNVEEEYIFFAIVIDENDKISKSLIKKEYKTSFFTVIRASSEEYKNLTVDVEITSWTKDPDFGYYNASFNVKTSDDIVKVYYRILADDEMGHMPAWKDKIKEITRWGDTRMVDELNGLSLYRPLPVNLMIICEKADGTIYETYKHVFNEADLPAQD